VNLFHPKVLAYPIEDVVILDLLLIHTIYPFIVLLYQLEKLGPRLRILHMPELMGQLTNGARYIVYITPS
jgi:hypothetical protein